MSRVRGLFHTGGILTGIKIQLFVVPENRVLEQLEARIHVVVG